MDGLVSQRGRYFWAGRYACVFMRPTYFRLIFKSLYRLYIIHDINGWVDGRWGG